MPLSANENLNVLPLLGIMTFFREENTWYAGSIMRYSGWSHMSGFFKNRGTKWVFYVVLIAACIEIYNRLSFPHVEATRVGFAIVFLIYGVWAIFPYLKDGSDSDNPAEKFSTVVIQAIYLLTFRISYLLLGLTYFATVLAIWLLEPASNQSLLAQGLKVLNETFPFLAKPLYVLAPDATPAIWSFPWGYFTYVLVLATYVAILKASLYRAVKLVLRGKVGELAGANAVSGFRG